MSTLETCAKILVECGYAEAFVPAALQTTTTLTPSMEHVQWDSDTLEGRRQADAIEDYLAHTDGYIVYWADSAIMIRNKDCGSEHQWRLDRISWCIEQVEL